MAGDWISFEMVTSDKPEVFEMAGQLEIDADAVVGKLLRVWSWFNQHTENGNASVTSKVLLDRLCGVSGFCESMISVGWLIEDSKTLVVPNWSRFNGKAAKKRLNTNRRVAEHRKKKRSGNAEDVTKSVTREEKRRVYTNTPIVPKGTEVDIAENSVSLHPLHVRIIRCITPNSKCDRKRDDSEQRVWRKVRGQITADDVSTVERFYGKPKSVDCDPTWKRKTGVTQLLNQWTEQLELAREFERSGRSGTVSGPTADEVLSAQYGGV